MHYMLFMCDDGTSSQPPSPEPARTEAWAGRMAERGIRHHGARVRPAAEAVTVRVRDGRTVVTEGPFEATERQLRGFEVVECADLDEALEAAGGHPAARGGVVEVRPFWED